MKKVYKYKICSICKLPKDENRNPYCKQCSKKYAKTYRLNKKLKPNVNLKGLYSFIIKIKEQNYMADDKDMLTILFFYEIITLNINEYDKYDVELQLNYMFRRLIRYYRKEMSKK
jgi:hypothetical protein